MTAWRCGSENKMGDYFELAEAIRAGERPLVFDYAGQTYPDFIRRGNAMSFILPAASHFCQGNGLDIGPGDHPFPGAWPIDIKDKMNQPSMAHGFDAMHLPDGEFDYIFSSHCLEHVCDPIGALQHWKEHLKSGGVLFLYLPHPDMIYWRPQFNRKHLHSWSPEQVYEILEDIGFREVIQTERDFYYSFATVGFKP